ncbi:MAG: restriction endonuclease, partial [Anaerolineales bacterium]
MPWLEIVSEIERDPTVLFALSGRRLEELVAGAYERQAWDDVILTRSSGDRGCGIIAVKHAICRVRIIDQCRRTLQTGAFVQNGVRALMGVPASDLNVAKGFVDTTAEF